MARQTKEQRKRSPSHGAIKEIHSYSQLFKFPFIPASQNNKNGAHHPVNQNCLINDA